MRLMLLLGMLGGVRFQVERMSGFGRVQLGTERP